MKKSYAWQTLGFTRKRKTYSASECETQIDFVLVGKKDRKYVRMVQVILRKREHRLVVIDLNERV